MKSFKKILLLIFLIFLKKFNQNSIKEVSSNGNYSINTIKHKNSFFYDTNYTKYQKICLLQGGLGNQMFIYAFGYAFQKKTKEALAFDIRQYITPIRKHAIFMLDKFKIKGKNYVKAKKKGYNIKKIDNDKISYDKEFFTLKGKWYYDSYFQNPKYFQKYRKQLLKIFSLKDPLDKANKNMLKDILSHKNSVSIHFRYGDYFKYKDRLGIIEDEYYLKAISFFKDKEDVHFYVFSNDLDLVKKKFKFGNNFTYVDINDVKNGHKDLWLMKNCKHNIIANSTFSWWSAWLNENKNKIVIAPNKMIKGIKNHRKEIFLKEWIKIDINFVNENK